jgi:rod shape-determining protein MreD
VGFGFMLDVFSFNYFGVYLLSYFFTIIFINYLYKNYLTDRSLYSFSILIVVFLVFYELVSKIFFYILYSINNQDIFFLTSKIFWMNIFSSLVINLFAMSILFYVVSLLSEKLKPVFLIKK